MIMTNNQIVEAVSGDVKSIIDNMVVKDDHRDDLFMEILLILLTYDHKKLEAIYNRSQIKFFVARIICNQYYSIHSAFYKKYKKYEDNKYNLMDNINKEDGETD